MKKGELLIKLSTIKNAIGSILLFVIFVLMTGHSVNTSWIQSYFPNGTILVLIASMIVYIFFNQKKRFILNWNFFLPFFLIFIIIFLYANINGSVEEIEKIVYIFLSFLLLYRSSLNYYNVIKIGLIICVSSIYATKGYNSYEINSLGIILSFGIVGLINFIDFNKKGKKLIIYIILAIISLLFISQTKMRGAILAITVIYIYTIFKELNTNKKRIVALIIIPFVLLPLWNDFSAFFEEYLFVNKWGGSDITAGRLNIWHYIIENAGVWGIGLNYINSYAHAHNTLVHFIGRYGFIILPLFIFLIYRVFITILNNSQKGNIRNSYFRVLILWLVFSLTETIDFIKAPLYIPQFMLLLYLVLLSRKEALNENKE